MGSPRRRACSPSQEPPSAPAVHGHHTARPIGPSQLPRRHSGYFQATGEEEAPRAQGHSLHGRARTSPSPKSAAPKSTEHLPLPCPAPAAPAPSLEPSAHWRPGFYSPKHTAARATSFCQLVTPLIKASSDFSLGIKPQHPPGLVKPCLCPVCNSHHAHGALDTPLPLGPSARPLPQCLCTC